MSILVSKYRHHSYRRLAPLIRSAPSITVLLTVAICMMHASSSVQAEDLTAAIDRLFSEPHLAGASVSMLAVDLKTGEVIYARNPDSSIIPASNMKLVTAGAALSNLGTDYMFRTDVFSSGRINDGVLNGDMYVKGYGDPFMVPEEMWKMVQDIKREGIVEITGDIVGDDSYFDHETCRLEAADGHEGFDARVGALSYNFNIVTVCAMGADRAGEPAEVWLEPDLGYFDLENNTMTVSKGSIRGNGAITLEEAENGNGESVSVGGRVGVNWGPGSFNRNVERPTDYFLWALKEMMENEGISVGGSLKRGRVPEEARLLVRHRSKPLSLIVRDLGKFSNNFTAEQLAKTLGAEFESEPGTWDKGLRVMGRYLQGLGLDSNRFTVADASGRSKQNRLSASVMVAVLKDGFEQFLYAPEFVSALSIGGIDGTLKNRFSYSRAKGLLRAKTGLLDGVCSLSGYLAREDGSILALSIIVNDYSGGAWQVWESQDRVVDLLYKH
jgi:D-alanyl-D-alanine carboxypeptidase/D-alanyl-D-alanine-endopeptidase (penicillin-binding protein 4)